ncbi:MAG: CvpA family protein [Chloroflexus sp.]|nr:CvpA family protein [Chloroflexus sp.]
MMLDVGAAVILVLFTVIGLRRGAWPSGFALMGTLIGAVLVDLWRDGVINVLGRLGLAAGWPLFLALSGLLILATIIGYGIDMIIELGLEDAEEWSHRLTGAAIGVINAALMITYLARYAVVAWSEAAMNERLAMALLTPLVIAWLPWGVLALTLLGGFILVLRIVHLFRTERQLYADVPRSPREADLRVLEQINRAIERRRR